VSWYCKFWYVYADYLCERRNLRFAEAHREKLPVLVARSELESRICLRSYRIFWQGKTQDAMHRAWSKSTSAQMETIKIKRKERFGKWLEQRTKALEEAARSPIVAQKPAVSPSPAAASEAPPAEAAASTVDAAKPVAPEVPAPAAAKGAEAEPISKTADGEVAEATKSKSAEPEAKQDSTGDVAMTDA
jgi:paired amphipathic helix protein Sin3a